ncbi:MAG: hypothetical protein JKY53_04700 [Flavobacteriales bacterium]|nr:hypothetical protein [Flavobacteriales bacterium]
MSKILKMWVAVFLIATNVYSQEPKNKIIYFGSLYNFFESGPDLKTRYLSTLPVYAGLGYTRKIDLKKSVKLSAEFHGADYSPLTGNDRYLITPGEIMSRQVYNFDLCYQHLIFFSERIGINALAGVNHRRGWESMVASFGAFDTHLIGIQLRDFGTTIGANVSINFAKRFLFLVQAQYTRFVYRYDNGSDSGYSFDTGSTANMFRLTTGIVYQFGTGKKDTEIIN